MGHTAASVNRQIVLVSGFARGGTNIVWNLICSHPGILTTGYELNEIYGPRRTKLPLIWKFAIEAFAVPELTPPPIVRKYMSSRIVEFAQQCKGNDWGLWKSKDEKYDEYELRYLPICTKSVSSWPRDGLYSLLKRNFSLKYNKALRNIFPDLRIVYVVRDPEAMCNGWMRRGCSPMLAGRWYRIIAKRMLEELREHRESIVLVNFSDVVNKPLLVAEYLHAFCGLEPHSLKEYRLKSKRVLNDDGSHLPIQGNVDDMNWILSGDVSAFLNPKVDSTQKAMLSEEERSQFFSELKGIDKEAFDACVKF